jgi:hypothetical protein
MAWSVSLMSLIDPDGPATTVTARIGRRGHRLELDQPLLHVAEVGELVVDPMHLRLEPLELGDQLVELRGHDKTLPESLAHDQSHPGGKLAWDVAERQIRRRGAPGAGDASSPAGAEVKVRVRDVQRQRHRTDERREPPQWPTAGAMSGATHTGTPSRRARLRTLVR